LLGQDVTFVLYGDDLTPNQLAQNVYLNVALPAGVTYVSSQADRGSGCKVVAANSLSCYLDFLSGQAPRGTVIIAGRVIAAGKQTLTATISTKQSESSLTNNSVTLVFGADASGGSTSAPAGLNGDSTPTKTQDKKTPTAQALASSSKRGSVAKLRFKIYDDRGTARALTTIKHGTTVVGTANTGYGPVAYGSVYFAPWSVPLRVSTGYYRFCVTAVDLAGNRSPQSCAPLTVK
jgi:hypothetical protein